MKNIMIALSIYFFLIAIGIVVYKMFFSERQLSVEQGKETMNLLEQKLQEEAHHEHNHENEAGYDFDEELVKIFRDVENTLNFFVTILKEEDEKYFVSMFLPEKFSKDLWEYSDDPFNERATLKLIRELNRDGKLVSAKYEENFLEDYKTTRLDSEIKLTLQYDDGKEALIQLDLILLGDEHSTENDIYFIENSVLELIRQVKQQTS